MVSIFWLQQHLGSFYMADDGHSLVATASTAHFLLNFFYFLMASICASIYMVTLRLAQYLRTWCACCPAAAAASSPAARASVLLSESYLACRMQNAGGHFVRIWQPLI
jgi:hypothetical protein